MLLHLELHRETVRLRVCARVHELLRVSEPARLTVCFDDGILVAAQEGGGGYWEGKQATRKPWREGTGGEMSPQFSSIFFNHPCQDSLTPFSISLIRVFGECGLCGKHM